MVARLQRPCPTVDRLASIHRGQGERGLLTFRADGDCLFGNLPPAMLDQSVQIAMVGENVLRGPSGAFPV